MTIRLHLRYRAEDGIWTPYISLISGFSVPRFSKSSIRITGVSSADGISTSLPSVTSTSFFCFDIALDDEHEHTIENSTKEKAYTM